jgi:hypothetical protein
MYGGMCTGAYAKAMMSVPGTMVNNNISVGIRFVMNNSLIQSARNQLADIFMDDKDSTHLMFIDADIEFDPMDIIHMINADVDVIGGVYPKKRIAWHRVREAIEAGVPDNKLELHTGDMVVNMLEGASQATVKADEPFEVKGVGTGFMLIKRSVFERLQGVVDTYLDDDEKVIHEYFALMKDPESGKQMSEDYTFCMMCRKIGIKIYIAPWAAFSHVGTYEFKGSPVRTYKDTQ